MANFLQVTSASKVVGYTSASLTWTYSDLGGDAAFLGAKKFTFTSWLGPSITSTSSAISHIFTLSSTGSPATQQDLRLIYKNNASPAGYYVISNSHSFSTNNAFTYVQA